MSDQPTEGTPPGEGELISSGEAQPAQPPPIPADAPAPVAPVEPAPVVTTPGAYVPPPEDEPEAAPPAEQIAAPVVERPAPISVAKGDVAYYEGKPVLITDITDEVVTAYPLPAALTISSSDLTETAAEYDPGRAAEIATTAQTESVQQHNV